MVCAAVGHLPPPERRDLKAGQQGWVVMASGTYGERQLSTRPQTGNRGTHPLIVLARLSEPALHLPRSSRAQKLHPEQPRIWKAQALFSKCVGRFGDPRHRTRLWRGAAARGGPKQHLIL